MGTVRTAGKSNSSIWQGTGYRLGLIIPLLAAMLLVPAPATAQMPTAEQLRLIESLPPEQRDRALEALRDTQGSGLSRVDESLSGSPGTTSSPLSPALAAEPVATESFASPNSRLIITATPRGSLTPAELETIESDPLLRQINGSNTFALDQTGVLSLFGVQSIALLGLSEADISRRLATESIFSLFEVRTRILTTKPIGVEALEPFGYSVFESNEASFDPPMAGPVPPDYVLGPGDTVRVQLFGNVNNIYELDVTRDGVVNLPDIGPMTVVGLPFAEFRSELNQRVTEMLIGTQVSVTMGQLRTIRIFVLGDSNRPGSYVVSSLATISSALYRSGGISRVGSLRNIQLKRGGNTEARLDLYDLLLNGDTSGDVRLQQGDAIFVPPIGPQASVSGAVNRPAIYELRGNSTVGGVIRLAGGFRADAYPAGARIERIDSGKERIVVGVDADSSEGTTSLVQGGDVLTIPQVLPELEDTVTLAGHVHRPGPFEWQQGMRIADLIGSLSDLRAGADSDYVLIRREDPETRRIRVLSTNLTAAIADRRAADNIVLHARDTVHVFSAAFGRQRIIQPILDELQLQSNTEDPFREVTVSGHVKAPGMFPLEAGMRVSDLVRAGGSLGEQAYTLKAELVRYEVTNGNDRNTRVIDVDLGAILRGDEQADLLLEEHDNLRISQIPDWDTLWTVMLDGEVTFPGQYRIRSGETLRELVERAGGLTDEAFAEGAVFLRESLREREQAQIELLAQRMQADLNSLSLESGTNSVESTETARSLLQQLRQTRTVGRLVIDVRQLSARSGAGEGVDDVELRDGDRVLVPKRPQEVTVIGESQQNTSHLFQAGLSRDDYIQMSGGLTRRADRKLIYVVRASGAVLTSGQSRWFGRRGGPEIRPGDTIVVPLEVDRIRPLTLWASVTQILYQTAIAIAAVDSFKD